MIGGLVSRMRARSVAMMPAGASVGARPASTEVLRLATMALAQAFDLATFAVMVARHGVHAEANPFVNDLFGAYGMTAVVVAKVALVLLIGALCVASSARGNRGAWSVVGGLPLALAIAAGLIGGITNASTLLP